MASLGKANEESHLALVITRRVISYIRMRHPERIRLANLPTPIQPLPRISRDFGKEIFVWRDDLTGFAESGNKIASSSSSPPKP